MCLCSLLLSVSQSINNYIIYDDNNNHFMYTDLAFNLSHFRLDMHLVCAKPLI